MKRRLWLALGGLAVVAGVGLAWYEGAFAVRRADPVMRLTAGDLHDVPLYMPADTPVAMVVYISDRGGWTRMDERIVSALADAGNAVLAVDYARYAAVLSQPTEDDCIYPAGDIVDLVQNAQREEKIETYLQPLVVGRGEGATLAYATLAGASDNTIDGAVAVDFRNRLNLPLPICNQPLPWPTADGRGRIYGFDKPLPGFGELLVRPQEMAKVTMSVGGLERLKIFPIEKNLPFQVAGAVARVTEAAHPLDSLPAVNMPPSGKPQAVSVMISGDGGWRDIDRQIAEWLPGRAIHSMGLDALHYFWSERTPQELAHDLTALIDEADPTGRLPVILIGFSFGADTIPSAWPYLPAAIRARTKLIALLSPGRSTSYQISVSGWLGGEGEGYDVADAIGKLPPGITLCVYGEEEAEDSGCTDPKASGIPDMQTPGGHHFDGDYQAMAQKLLEHAGIL